MKIMLIPGLNNRMLLDTLRDYYITDEFMKHLENIAYVTSPKALELETSRLILMTINKLLLVNAYRYFERGAMDVFTRLLENRNLHMDLEVPLHILYDLIDLTMPNDRGELEVFEAQCMLIRVVTDLVGSIQSSRPDDFAQAHVELVDGFYTYVPVARMAVSRFDFSPNLVPMAFYEPLP